MSIALYTDEHINGGIIRGLRQRGVDVLTVVEDGMAGSPDPLVLDRALALGRAVFTHDADYLREAHRRLQSGEPFAGVIYAHATGPSIGKCIDDLELIAKVTNPDDLLNAIIRLPI